MGVDFSAISLKQGRVVKEIIKTLVSVLSDVSSPSFAVHIIDKEIDKIISKYEALKFIIIDKTKYSEGINAIKISSDIDNASTAEVGKGIQKLIEKIIFALGEEAGKNLLNKLKKRLGQAYLLRVEELGVNLYMIELKYSMAW